MNIHFDLISDLLLYSMMIQFFPAGCSLTLGHFQFAASSANWISASTMNSVLYYLIFINLKFVQFIFRTIFAFCLNNNKLVIHVKSVCFQFHFFTQRKINKLKSTNLHDFRACQMIFSSLFFWDDLQQCTSVVRQDMMLRHIYFSLYKIICLFSEIFMMIFLFYLNFVPLSPTAQNCRASLQLYSVASALALSQEALLVPRILTNPLQIP